MRDDLELMGYATKIGYKVVFDERDIRANRTTKESCPCHNLSFETNNVWIWQCGESYPEPRLWWQARTVTDRILHPYDTRREYTSLKEALDTEIKYDTYTRPTN